MATLDQTWSPPSGYTTNLSLKKWNNGDNPGADALNSNWDAIDAAINASGNANSFISPLVKDQFDQVQLTINGTNLKVNGTNQLDTIQDIHTNAAPEFQRTLTKESLRIINDGSATTGVGVYNTNNQFIGSFGFDINDLTWKTNQKVTINNDLTVNSFTTTNFNAQNVNSIGNVHAGYGDDSVGFSNIGFYVGASNRGRSLTFTEGLGFYDLYNNYYETQKQEWKLTGGDLNIVSQSLSVGTKITSPLILSSEIRSNLVRGSHFYENQDSIHTITGWKIDIDNDTSLGTITINKVSANNIQTPTGAYYTKCFGIVITLPTENVNIGDTGFVSANTGSMYVCSSISYGQPMWTEFAIV